MDKHLAFCFTPEDMAGGGTAPRLHLGVCGSVAAYRGLDLLRQWQDAGFSVSTTLTPSAQRFITPLSFEALGAEPIYTSMYQDARASTPFPHLEPAQTARAFIIAPASAATLARLAHGASDELLACQALAFGGNIVLAPAMNPSMWEHKATQANVALLQERGCRIVPPGLGRTACGEMGQGRMAEVRDIWLAGIRAALPQTLKGVRALVTLGPTREPWDGVRFWTNPSSGIMGSALAVALWLRGAEVHAICGPRTPWLPSSAWIGDSAPLVRHNVTSACEMYCAASDLWPLMDAGIFTAAVADFAPEPFGADKFKKVTSPEGFSIRFTPNPDILHSLSAHRRSDVPQRVMGFAAESDQLEEAVRGKLHTKQADMVVGNLLNDGFGTSSNTVYVVDRTGREESLPPMSKPALAWRLTEWLFSL